MINESRRSVMDSESARIQNSERQIIDNTLLAHSKRVVFQSAREGSLLIVQIRDFCVEEILQGEEEG